MTAALGQVDEKVHRAPDLGGGVVWLDQGAPVPHHISGYRGHVVLVDFWEYTCINCIRDFTVIKRWYSKYHQYGFDVIGVHYGEFNIGFKVSNVRDAAQRFRLPWAVVADQEGSAWKAYASQGWPNRYLIDAKGQIVMRIFGEGNNGVMEAKIRDLLAAEHPEVMKIDLIRTTTNSGRSAEALRRRLTWASYMGAARSRIWAAITRVMCQISCRSTRLRMAE